MRVYRSTFTGNSVNGSGGAIAAFGVSSGILIMGSVFTNNRAR